MSFKLTQTLLGRNTVVCLTPRKVFLVAQTRPRVLDTLLVILDARSIYSYMLADLAPVLTDLSLPW